jgi:oxygen-independent coproporphyrinogen-3 oxidase
VGLEAVEKAHQRHGMIRHLYVHIPFCHRVCPYCSFYKHEPGGTDIPAFLAAILTEARVAAERWTLQPETIYFGGGTPSMLSSTLLERWLPEFRAVFDLSALREWTFEINPRTMIENKAALLVAQGVTRASLGVQAWDEPSLAVLGRDHSPAEAEETYQLLRSARFPAVSLDLMFSIPGQSVETWRASLRRTLTLQPDHISAYNLTYEEDTPFFDKLGAGDFACDEERDADCFASAIELLTGTGFEHYEISNYARPGFASLHNQSYWAGADYLGLGPGAVSTVERVRWKNVENTARYLLDPAAGRAEEHLTDSQWACERLALELRTSRGVALEYVPDPDRIPELAAAGMVETAGGRLRLTAGGKPLADSIAAHLWT